ncbi:ABC transporter ATP-binding protein [Halothiobacillus sp. DCM-1]|uniref:ABC transporter ATP-binding protein n=1 Tax=Halothiobacillus sp. DCM-1 TaxID=3112558 RepID=UPI0032448541
MESQSAALLRVERLTAAFSAEEAVLHEVSFSVPPGARFALVGESGSGKTVTALTILRLLDGLTVTPESRVWWGGQDLLRLPDRALRAVRGREIGFVFQEPMSAFNPLKSIGAQIGEVIERHEGLVRSAVRARVLALLGQVQLPEPERLFEALPHQLSGGQRQRAMIAMALACRPKLLIADEPTTALDAQIRQQILQLLRRLQDEMELSILLITHDLPLVLRFATEVAVMQRGRIVEQGRVEAVFTRPAHAYTQALLSSSFEGVAPAPAASLPSVLRVTGLSVAYAARNPARWFRRAPPVTVLHPLDFSLAVGETLGVIGESGSGKTTLALALMRLIAARGEIVLAEQVVSALSERRFRPFRREIQIVFQDPFSALSPRMTLGEIVGEGLAVHEPTLSVEARRARVDAVLAAVGLGSVALDRYPHEFSGGQRQRIAIARALILQPKILVLDEPTSALDATVQAQILALLRQLQQSMGLSYLLITHDLRVVRAMAHRVLVLRAGRVVEQGETAEVFARPQADYTRLLLDADQGAL